MSDYDISNILIDFCALFDGTVRFRFSYLDSVVFFDYTPSTWYEWNYPFRLSPVANYELINTFVPSYPIIRPHLLSDCLFYIDLPTVCGYHSPRGKWLITGTHHTRITFDADVLFAH